MGACACDMGMAVYADMIPRGLAGVQDKFWVQIDARAISGAHPAAFPPCERPPSGHSRPLPTQQMIAKGASRPPRPSCRAPEMARKGADFLGETHR